MKFIVEIDTKKFRTEDKLARYLAVQGELKTSNINVTHAPKLDLSRAGRFSAAADQIADGRSAIEELKDEMEQWRESIPENLQGGEKYAAVEQCCDALEYVLDEIPQSLDEPDFPGTF